MKKAEKQKLIVICGPTGIGKTNLSLALAEAFNGAVVSCDSMQIYRYMDIGTAKPDAVERQRAPHYMMDIIDPDEDYDAARFFRDARQAIIRIQTFGQVPLVVGGTGFYLKALLHGLFETKPVNTEIIRRLKAEANVSGSQTMFDRLAASDPEAAVRIHPNDCYRVIRALAVLEMSGKSMSGHQQDHGFPESPFNVLKFCLHMDRDGLYKRINHRVDKMVADGLLEEVRRLRKMGFSETLRPMQAIGYRHMNDFISGRMEWNETIDLLKRDTRRFAKRQLTWFRKDTEMIWISPEDVEGIVQMVREFLTTGRRLKTED